MSIPKFALSHNIQLLANFIFLLGDTHCFCLVEFEFYLITIAKKMIFLPQLLQAAY
jgi:hypothetical protein